MAMAMAMEDNEGEEEHPSFPNHKLCGYLCTVLTSSHPSPPLGTRFHILRHDSHLVFRSDDVVLSPVDSPETKLSGSEESCGTPVGMGKRKRKRSIGMVNGSMSIVEQIYALLTNKCLQIDARMVWAEEFNGVSTSNSTSVAGEVRVVLLVDVYLPIEFWSGWQFPKCGSVAGAVFKHLSCNWEQRRLMIANVDYVKDTLAAGRGMWNLSDCHVLGCELHYNVTDTSKKKLFELHEIFQSLPSITEMGYPNSYRIQPVGDYSGSGIWELSDDILIKILALLGPTDLVRTAVTCRNLRFLTALIMPCMKLKLFPHQQAAVQWMLHREQHAEVMPHPLYIAFTTEDGFSFHVSTITGEIVSDIPPTVNDFRGGMFCDEPGLGKTITALSLILKTQGKSADPPDGVNVIRCTHNGDQACGYYDLNNDYVVGSIVTPGKRVVNNKANTGGEKLGYCSSKRGRPSFPNEHNARVKELCSNKQKETPGATCSEPALPVTRCTRNLSRVRKSLFSTEDKDYGHLNEKKAALNSRKGKQTLDGAGQVSWEKHTDLSYELSNMSKKPSKVTTDHDNCNDTWIQCDACSKWRRFLESSTSDANITWFCSMNTDPLYQSCTVPEETWDKGEPILSLQGFYTKGTSGGQEQNILFFANVLKEHRFLMNFATKTALRWLITLSPEKLSEMETIGLRGPFISTCVESGEDAIGFQKIFESFGLRREVTKRIIRWCYPQNLRNLVFDVAALKIALSQPLDSTSRLYVSRATLIVVPANLVDHWKTQIQKHVRPGQLRIYLWTDNRKPSAHSLAWDYDVVITTFNRLSAEWGTRKRSVLMQVHWLRVMLDEGHTLGSSVGLTNKLQMAVSLVASNRWILTGTPTPNTPNSHLSHLQPLLRFLHEEAYGLNQKSWEAGILRPFEAEMEEGRSRLLHLLRRCMISARKVDLKNIPPCIKKVTFVDFTEAHARSYNELVVTVRRNILLADWNDPSHVESLLNPKQWKSRSTTIKNIRLSCCVAGHIKVTDAGEDIQETMDVLVEEGLDPMSEEYAFIKYNLLYGGNCVRCGERCRLPVITPCRHLLCLDCVELDSRRCTYPGCGNLYEMQTPDTLARPENRNPKWDVPKDLIELQPSYKQDNWDPDWQSTSSSKVSYLIHKLKELQDANREVYQSMDGGTGNQNIEFLLSSSRMNEFDERTQDFGSFRTSSTHKRIKDKVLVFSQFLEHIHVIEQQLTMADIKFAGMYSPMHAGNKMKSLATFQYDSNCMVLLMDGSAALGLDLSFVSHVFLMEPIWDKSMEEQVISRAHRMGATRPIQVETLAMRGTIEEQMLTFLQDPEECRKLLKQQFGRTDSEGTRNHRSLHDFAESNYLSHIGFVRKNPKT
ncbi:F-box protein At3g54460 [Cannabis sativa]|uniref:F-box protein At3g54460 n=1 Tax=Cannabis sativa TaxID=3483 RepID=UPI0029CA7762|nr:F-box protein At3g54460 [Cannabis sativa]